MKLASCDDGVPISLDKSTFLSTLANRFQAPLRAVDYSSELTTTGQYLVLFAKAGE
jgi:hypothetical protein